MRSGAKLSQVKDAQSVRCHAQLFPPIGLLSPPFSLSVTHLQSRLSFLLVKSGPNLPCNLSASLISNATESTSNWSNKHLSSTCSGMPGEGEGGSGSRSWTTSRQPYLISCSHCSDDSTICAAAQVFPGSGKGAVHCVWVNYLCNCTSEGRQSSF